MGTSSTIRKVIKFLPSSSHNSCRTYKDITKDIKPSIRKVVNGHNISLVLTITIGESKFLCIEEPQYQDGKIVSLEGLLSRVTIEKEGNIGKEQEE